MFQFGFKSGNSFGLHSAKIMKKQGKGNYGSSCINKIGLKYG
jgi:hypothetical protein